MNQILSFTYDTTNIRTITTEDGTPLFCASDVATTPSLIALDAHRKHASLPKATFTG